ncbi:hypothetical protein ALC152_04980 [Arcobacter sp. 15-2]|uniref:antirestriction protein ArdA n=1 Tax=Arcobacter sp. 15-2 TaxID=3374109 RepID=UPI00399C505C
MLKIYITDLSAYNQSFLIGKWITLPMCEEELQEEIQSILKEGSEACGFNETHEEVFITDYEFETEYSLFTVNEYSSISELNEKCEELSQYDEHDLKRISYLLDHLNYDLEAAIEHYDEVHVYEDMTMRDVAEEYIESTVNLSELPDIVSNNIDYDAIARDFEIDSAYEVIENDVFFYVS